jgi:hypothetical protein
MDTLLQPVRGLLYLICIGIDITIFFLVVRLVVTEWHTSCLEGFDGVGKSLVDGVRRNVRALWFRVAQRHLSQRGELLFGILALYVAEVVVCVVARSC